MERFEDTAREATEIGPEKFARDEARVRAGFWDKVRGLVGRLSFVEDAVAAYYCARDPATPFKAKAIAMGALAYFVLPADAVPDILVAFGFIDDAAVLAYAYRQIQQHVQPTHRELARQALAGLREDDNDRDDDGPA